MRGARLAMLVALAACSGAAPRPELPSARLPDARARDELLVYARSDSHVHGALRWTTRDGARGGAIEPPLYVPGHAGPLGGGAWLEAATAGTGVVDDSDRVFALLARAGERVVATTLRAPYVTSVAPDGGHALVRCLTGEICLASVRAGGVAMPAAIPALTGDDHVVGWASSGAALIVVRRPLRAAAPPAGPHQPSVRITDIAHWQIARIDVATGARRELGEMSGDRAPTIDATGAWLASVLVGRGRVAIHALAGGSDRVVVLGGGFGHCQPTATGAAVCIRYDGPARTLVVLAAGASHVLADDADDRFALSADGRRVAFSERAGTRLVVANLDGGERHVVADAPPDTLLEPVVWLAAAGAAEAGTLHSMAP